MNRPALALALWTLTLVAVPAAHAKGYSLLGAADHHAHAGWLLSAEPPGASGPASATFASAPPLGPGGSGRWQRVSTEPPLEVEPGAPAGASRLELEAEYEELEANDIGIGGSVAMVVVGGSAAFLGLFYGMVFLAMEADSTSGLGPGLGPLLTVCFGAAAAGAALLAVGIIQLAKRSRERTGRERRMRELRRELRRLPPEPAVPPAVPPSVRSFVEVPLVTLATF